MEHCKISATMCKASSKTFASSGMMVLSNTVQGRSLILFCLAMLQCFFGMCLGEGHALYPDCPDVPPGWFPECSRTGHARIQLSRHRMVLWSPFTDGRNLGNALSPYWQARGIAELAGHGFEAAISFRGSWLQYLPTKLAPQKCPNLPVWNEACHICDDDSWQYAHRCSGAWQFIRPTISNDTHAAVQQWAAATNHSLPAFQPGDTVIQSRCNKDTLLHHPEYGPVAFSYYRNIKPMVKNIYIVTNPGVSEPACSDIRHAQVAWLKQNYPNSNVQVIGGSLEQDFLRLLLAPVLFRDSQSSFGLWAGMANMGEVWSVPLLSVFARYPTPNLGANWHWIDAPVLYPHIAQAANISIYDASGIIRWLRDH